MISSGFSDHLPFFFGSLRAAPAALSTRAVGWLGALAAARTRAWDCGTGNGQAAIGPAEFFDVVATTDASASQIESALAHARARCRVAAAENPELEHRSVDLISVTRAPHWFDLPRFYSQTSYALIGGGVRTAWCWGRCRIGARIDAVIATLSRDILGPYWPAQRNHIDDACSSNDFPYDCISVPRFEIRAR